MHIHIRLLIAALLALRLSGSLAAQSAAVADVLDLTTAARLRGELADNVLKGMVTADEGITQLRAQNSPSGLKIGGDLDFALAAIDVGQRLVPTNNPPAADKFFLEAEKALASALKNIPDSQAWDRAELLKHLAFVRGVYLHNVAQARLDIEQAIALQPDNKHLLEVRDNLARGNAEFFKDKRKD